ncbi:metallophosphoesterase family protein [Streptomyces sp. NPDC060028]|uniref:metallophosphoesterase family protein n=1 Tax=Streptomyces sp. NPDC060028 TaxID=3347041 RepID=UPI003674C113
MTEADPGGLLTTSARLLAVSDLHVAYAENRSVLERLRPTSEGDWLVVAGDVGELVSDVERALGILARRFERVIWAPGNHELWTHPKDPCRLRGEKRYAHLVDLCRSIGVLTPEDPYAVWQGDGGPAVVAPLFVLYDYSFRAPGTLTKAESLARAVATGVVCADEFLLHPDPHPTRDAWCRARLAETERRLAEIDFALPVVLVNHFPLKREETAVLRHPEFAQWCGSEQTADWHTRYGATAVVYGHLHIPRTTWHDGVRFEEVSLGYPRERLKRAVDRPWPVQILPAPGGAA